MREDTFIRMMIKTKLDILSKPRLLRINNYVDKMVEETRHECEGKDTNGEADYTRKSVQKKQNDR